MRIATYALLCVRHQYYQYCTTVISGSPQRLTLIFNTNRGIFIYRCMALHIFGQVLRSWLGFCLKRNPFLVPVSLERLAGVSGLTPKCGQNIFFADKKGFTDVGGEPHRAGKRSTQLLDDHSTSDAIGGSAIADGDMLRVRAAAAIIMHEETIHGR